ncbi:DUF5362 family protein [Pontibacter amylolyticus]|uniref:DUF5362 domain-containing protein n=1 Tax=Pontibacter amylolyticus TaxID=1424080 RepID=A0ABQ1W4J1_9BACT|nr:DUF5362 family protein [Pontibacter amylolyticus]GGG11747.1 hypothetical protein GCM10011323_15260 [Pontibacter amylolyticus]
MEAELYNEQPLGMQLSPDSRYFLSAAAKWGKFLSIVGFVILGFVGLAGLFMSAIFLGGMGNVSGGNFLNSATAGIGVGLFYFLGALLYFILILYLYKFSSHMQTGLSTNNKEVISKSFRNLKSLFKFMGILTIIMLVIYALGLLFMPFGAFVGAFF